MYVAISQQSEFKEIHAHAERSTLAAARTEQRRNRIPSNTTARAQQQNTKLSEE
jgi:hypothetical protein